MVPLAGLEPACLQEATDFESAASTNSATKASTPLYIFTFHYQVFYLVRALLFLLRVLPVPPPTPSLAPADILLTS